MMNRPETQRTEFRATREKETLTDRTPIFREYAQPNSAKVIVDKVGKRFLIKRQENVGT